MLADEVLFGALSKGGVAKVDLADDKLVYSFQANAPEGRGSGRAGRTRQLDERVEERAGCRRSRLRALRDHRVVQPRGVVAFGIVDRVMQPA